MQQRLDHVPRTDLARGLLLLRVLHADVATAVAARRALNVCKTLLGAVDEPIVELRGYAGHRGPDDRRHGVVDRAHVGCNPRNLRADQGVGLKDNEQ